MYYDDEVTAACAVVGGLFPHVGATLAEKARAKRDKAQRKRVTEGRAAMSHMRGGLSRAMPRRFARDEAPAPEQYNADPYAGPYDAPTAPGMPVGYQLPPQYGGPQTPWFAEQPSGYGYGGYPSTAPEDDYYGGTPEGTDYE